MVTALYDPKIVEVSIETLATFGRAAVPALTNAAIHETGFVRPAEVALEKIDWKAADKIKAAKNLPREK